MFFGLGFGLPLLVHSLLAGSARRWITRQVAQHTRLVNLVGGLLLIGVSLYDAVGIFFSKCFHLSWRLWWIGATTFVLSQVGHIPFNSLLTWMGQRGIIPSPPTEARLAVNAVILGLSAGLWEELSRYAAYRWWAKDARSWRKGIFLGAGHGGVEAILVGAVTFYAFINLVALRGADLSKIVPASQLALAQQQVNTYWSAPWPATLMGGIVVNWCL
ncbi:MAG TPA: YhfC family glutamic-type intramembrane protease [Anaerolineaceae bacterium]|nr:YhfC family glutamic-type intramembrane protease [Anaerolineaceae bacterium]